MPLFFNGQITNTNLVLTATLAFLSFSFTASAIYIVNDYHDIASDQQHPQKKHRPLASGAISKSNAIIIMFILFILGISIMAKLSFTALYILTIYISLNLIYSFHIKHIAILDVTIIAIGFVLRLFIGSNINAIPLSKWIVIITFLLALFLALAKRRDDVLIFLDTGKKMRKAIDGYNLKFIDASMIIMAAVIIVAYLLYTTSIEVLQRIQHEYLYLTAIFVILGILRYLQITFVEQNSGSPTEIVLKDSFLQLTILAWITAFAWIIYS